MTIAFFNGTFLDVDQKVIPIDERGHQFGDGVYEVIRVYGGKPFLMRDHLLRLERSGEAIQLKGNYTVSELEQIILEGLTKSQLLEAEVYIQVTRGISPRQHLFPDVPASTSMTIRPARTISEKARKEGVAVLLMEDERWANCFVKSLNLLPNILAKQNAVSQGFYEAIFHRDGVITEGSSCNIFAVKNGALHTPQATKRILHGITRANVLTIANELEIPVKEEDITIGFLMESDEVFITSTTMEILPVQSLSSENGNQVVFREPGLITKRLHERYQSQFLANRQHTGE